MIPAILPSEFAATVVRALCLYANCHKKQDFSKQNKIVDILVDILKCYPKILLPCPQFVAEMSYKAKN